MKKTNKEKTKDNIQWFKSLWMDDNVDDDDFDTYFQKYNIYWFSDFRVFYESMLSMESHIQHPDHTLPKD